MKLGTLEPHLLYLKNDVLFEFQFGNIAAPQAAKTNFGPLTPFPPTSYQKIINKKGVYSYLQT